MMVGPRRLRSQPVAGRQKGAGFHVALGLLALQVIDSLVSWGILVGYRFAGAGEVILLVADLAPTLLFVLISAAVAVRVRRGRNFAVNRYAIVYLSVATVQVIVNIVLLVSGGEPFRDSLIWGLAVLGGAYLLVVAVFTGWYWLFDKMTVGGAFDFPEAEVIPGFRPNIVDYLFISFNTNSTFGPTAELVKSRYVKVLMMLQTALSLAILLVFVARLTGLAK